MSRIIIAHLERRKWMAILYTETLAGSTLAKPKPHWHPDRMISKKA